MAKTAQPASRRRFSPLLVMILVIVPLALVYLAVFLRQLGEIEERNVRLLETAARRVEGVLENAQKTVGNLTRDLDFACELDARQPYLHPHNPASCGELTRLVGRSFETPRLRPERRQLLVDVTEKLLPTADGETELGPPRNLSFRIDFERILADVPLDVFAGLLIADGEGRVIHRSSRLLGGLRLQSLDPNLLAPAGKKDAPSADAPPDLARLRSATRVFEVPFANTRYQVFCQPLELPGVTGGDDAGEWVLCGLSTAPSSIEEALLVSPGLTVVLGVVLVFGVVGGPLVRLALLKRQERFRLRDAYVLLLATFATLLLTTLALFDLDSYRRLGSESEEALESLAHEVEEHLRRELRDARDQLTAYDRGLASLGPESAVGAMFRSLADGTWKPGREHLVETTHLLGPRTGGGFTLPLSGGEPPSIYPYYSSVFWMNDDGWQLVKGAVRDRNTPQVQLSARPYFQHVAERSLWCFEGRRLYVQSFRSITTGEHSTALSIRSRLTDCRRAGSLPCAGDETAEATCGDGGVDDGEGVDPGPIVAAAISTTPLATTDPVLAPGFGFAVVGTDGHALYHSDGRRALDERLFEEVASPRRLEAAVLSRSGRHLRTRYLTSPHHFYVRPVGGLPWAVVAFREEEELHTANLEAMAHALALSAVYFFTFVAAMAVVLFLIRQRPELQPTWLWPHAGWTPLYRLLTLVYTALGVVAVTAIALLSGDGVLAVSFSLWPVAALVMATCFYVWRRRPRGDEAATGQADSQWYYSASLMLWLLVAVVPAGGFFKVAWEDELRLLRRHEDLHLADLLGRRACRVEAEYRRFADEQLALSGPEDAARVEEYTSRLAAERQDEDLDLYLSSTFVRQRLPREEEPDGRVETTSSFADLLARYWPLYNPTSTRLLYLRRSAGDGAWSWRRRGSEVVFEASLPEACGGPVRLVASGTDGPHLGAFTFFGGGVVVLALFLWVRYSGRHLFFAEIGRQVDPLAVEALTRHRPQTHVVAVIASPAAREVLCRSKLYKPVDLEADLDDKTPAAVLCGAFEEGLDDPERRRKKLATLEALTASPKRRVVVLSTLDPWSELTRLYREVEEKPAPAKAGKREEAKKDGEAPPPPPKTVDADEMRRWARLLSDFVVVPIDRPRRAAAAAEDGRTPPSRGRAWVERELGRDARDAQLEDLVVRGLYRGAVAEGESASRAARRALARLAEESPREARERLLEAAQGYYWALWTACSEDEKLVLVHLAQEKFVNPKQRAAVRRLLQRGLLEREPALRLMNESFALFVERVHEPDKVALWERSARGFGWVELRWAFLALLAVIALFLFTTQRQLFENTLVFLSALAVAVPTLLRLLKTGSGAD